MTVGTLIDRIFREFLHPLDDFPRHVPLATTITDSSTSIVYEDGYLTPEEIDMLDVGGKFQIGRELIMATAIDTGTQTITVTAETRGILGTVAAGADAGAFIYLDPPYTRQAVYDSLVGAIPSLEPPLYKVATEEVWGTTFAWELPVGAFEIVDSRYQYGGQWEEGGGGTLISGDPDANSGVSVQLNPPYGSRNIVRYKTSFGAVTDEDTTLSDIGITTEMEYPLMLETVARVMATVDIKPATQEYIAQAIETQGYPPASGERLRNALLSFASLLVARIANKMQIRDPLGEERLAAYPGAPT